MMHNLIFNLLPSFPPTQPRWLRHAARRCALPNQTWGPAISASWAHYRGTLNCQTLTATENPSTPAPLTANRRQRTTRNLLLRNRSSPQLPKELTCTPEPSSLFPSSSLMWFTGPYTCDYLEFINSTPLSHKFRLRLQVIINEMWSSY